MCYPPHKGPSLDHFYFYLYVNVWATTCDKIFQVFIVDDIKMFVTGNTH